MLAGVMESQTHLTPKILLLLNNGLKPTERQNSIRFYFLMCMTTPAMLH